MTCFEPQGDASELAPHPHRLTLRGVASGLEFPPLCPNCGRAAADRLRYAKVFRHTDSDGPTRYVVASIAVPFCDACIARHRAQEVKRTLMSDLIFSFATMDMLGAVFPALGALFLFYLALGDLFHGRGTRVLVELGIGAVLPDRVGAGACDLASDRAFPRAAAERRDDRIRLQRRHRAGFRVGALHLHDAQSGVRKCASRAQHRARIPACEPASTGRAPPLEPPAVDLRRTARSVRALERAARSVRGIFETSISDLGTGRSAKRLVLRDSRASPDRGLLFELYHPMLVEARDPYVRLRGIEETPLGQGERGAMVQEWLVRFIG